MVSSGPISTASAARPKLLQQFLRDHEIVRVLAFAEAVMDGGQQRERLAGYRDALVGAGLPYDEALICDSMPNRNGGAEAIAAALSAPVLPTAAFCYNDIVAMGATRALALRGIRVGVDFAVVGFDDIVEAEHNAPPLTTVNADTRLMGTRAARSLLGLIDGADPEAMSYTGTTRLVVRESCGAQRREIFKETA